MIHSIIHEARDRILSSRILSGNQPTIFLQHACNENSGVSEHELIEAALCAGLYAQLGHLYQFKLDDSIDGARLAIISGVIRAPIMLREYLAIASAQIPGVCDTQKTCNHLLIDARQKGLYEYLEQEYGRLDSLCDQTKPDAEPLNDDVKETEAAA